MTTLKSNLLKKGKKGFTLTELAIVIAVIAILIAVLVPTFTSVITNARETAAAEDATHAITAYTLENESALEDGSVIEVVNGNYTYYFVVSGGTVGEAQDSATIDSTMDKYTFTGTEYESTFSSITIYCVVDTDTAALYATAKTTADAALSEFNSDTSYGASTSSTITADYIVVGTYWYEVVNNNSLTKLSDATATIVSTSLSSATPVYYTGSAIDTSNTSAVATIYYTETN